MRIGTRTTGATARGAPAWATPEVATTAMANTKQAASSGRTKMDRSMMGLGRSKLFAQRQNVHNFPAAPFIKTFDLGVIAIAHQISFAATASHQPRLELV